MPNLLIPGPAREELFALLASDRGQIEKLSELLNSPRGLGSMSPDFLSDVGDTLGITIEDAYDVVAVIGFLSQQRSALKCSDDEFVDDMIKWSERTKSEGEATVAKKLREPTFRKAIAGLFGEKPVAELARKKKKLETGLIKTLTAIEGTCELRPVFNLERSHIVDKVFTVIARITIQDDQMEKDSVVFQLNEQSLKELKEFLETTEKKLEIMNTEITAVEATK